MKVVKLYINGVEKNFIKLHYVKQHPNPDPDTFEVTLDEDAAGDVDHFQTVEVRKDGVTEYYGFVEEITPSEDSESGTDVVVSGRCWKLLLWKKYNERFQESRDVGPLNPDGTTESGFFGSVNPVELFKFILRCPMSVHPKGHLRHKIGWGIPSDDWICCANRTTDVRYPDWVGLRYTGLSWRGSGEQSEMVYSHLDVDGYDAAMAGTAWYFVGASPYLDTDDADTNCIYRNAVLASGVGAVGDFSFEDLGPTIEGIFATALKIKYLYGHDDIQVHLYDGTTWHIIGRLSYVPTWTTMHFDTGGILTTIAKINAAKLRFYVNTLTPVTVKVTYAWLWVASGETSSPIYQQQDDWFAINLGAAYDDVTGILIECRNSPSCYPENYRIEYTTLSNCCDDTYPVGEDDWHVFVDAGADVNVGGNTFRDVLHSWKPVDNVHGIRIKLWADGDNAWEISQIYVYQADDIKYRLLDET